MESLEEKQIHYLAQKYKEYNLPLYLSYPIDSAWKAPGEEWSGKIKLKEADRADLYVHFPYCKQICYFCCCEKAVASKQEIYERYLDRIEQEFAIRMESHTIKQVSGMHWGGGTPVLMNEKQMERLYQTISRYFQLDGAEIINIESYPDPDVLTREKLAFMKKLGFTSISLGIQDFDKRVQAAIHRQADIEKTSQIVNIAKSLGFLIHVDLCYGLPYQGLNEFEKTLKAVQKMEPEQIVIYPYAHYPFIFPLQRKILNDSIPNTFIKTMLLHMADQMLSSEYTKFGMDTYIRKSGGEEFRWSKRKITRDFMGTSVYTEQELWGFGSSAITCTEDWMGKNISKIENYEAAVQSNNWKLEALHILTEEDKLRQCLIQKNLLGNMKIDITDLEQTYQIDFREHFARELEQLKELEADGLVAYTEGRNVGILLTEYGKLFPRTVAHIFNQYYK